MVLDLLSTREMGALPESGCGDQRRERCQQDEGNLPAAKLQQPGSGDGGERRRQGLDGTEPPHGGGRLVGRIEAMDKTRRKDGRAGAEGTLSKAQRNQPFDRR